MGEVSQHWQVNFVTNCHAIRHSPAPALAPLELVGWARIVWQIRWTLWQFVTELTVFVTNLGGELRSLAGAKFSPRLRLTLSVSKTLKRFARTLPPLSYQFPNNKMKSTCWFLLVNFCEAKKFFSRQKNTRTQHTAGCGYRSQLGSASFGKSYPELALPSVLLCWSCLTSDWFSWP